MDDETTGQGRGRRRRGGGRGGRGQRQRGATRSGENDDDAPPPPGVGGIGICFGAGDTIRVWGGKRPWVTAMDTPSSCFSVLSRGGNLLALLVSSSLSSSSSSSSPLSSSLSSSTGAGYQRKCQRGHIGEYREPVMTTECGRSRYQKGGCWQTTSGGGWRTRKVGDGGIWWNWIRNQNIQIKVRYWSTVSNSGADLSPNSPIQIGGRVRLGFQGWWGEGEAAQENEGDGTDRVRIN